MSTHTRARIYDTLPALMPAVFGLGDSGGPITAGAPELARLDATTQRQVGDFLGSPGFDDWSQALARVGT